MKAINFIKEHLYIVFILALIPFVVVSIYLNEQIFNLKYANEYIQRPMLIHCIYISFFKLLFAILLAKSLKDIYFKLNFYIRLIIKIILLGVGLFYGYVFLGFTLNLLENTSEINRLYEYLIAELTGISASLGFLYNSFIIPLKNKKN